MLFRKKNSVCLGCSLSMRYFTIEKSNSPPIPALLAALIANRIQALYIDKIVKTKTTLQYNELPHTEVNDGNGFFCLKFAFPKELLYQQQLMTHNNWEAPKAMRLCRSDLAHGFNDQQKIEIIKRGSGASPPNTGSYLFNSPGSVFKGVLDPSEPNDSYSAYLLSKHRKNCKCCPRHSLFKGHNVKLNIIVFNCQK